MGVWEGQAVAGNRLWEEYQARLNQGEDYIPNINGVETYEHCFTRVKEAMEDIVNNHDGNVLIVGHELSAQIMLAIAKGCKDSKTFLLEYRNRPYLDNCSVTEIIVEEKKYSVVHENYSPLGFKVDLPFKDITTY